MNDEDQGEFSLPEVDFKKEEELWVKSPYLDQKPPQLENEKRAPKHTFPKLIAEALFKVSFIYYVSTFLTQNLIFHKTWGFNEIRMLDFEIVIT